MWEQSAMSLIGWMTPLLNLLIRFSVTQIHFPLWNKSLSVLFRNDSRFKFFLFLFLFLFPLLLAENDKLTLKFIKECKRPRIAETILKKNKVGGLTLSDSKICKITLINIIWSFQKGRQSNRTEARNKPTHMWAFDLWRNWHCRAMEKGIF